jgi:oligopeptide transport system substrate-binding protein
MQQVDVDFTTTYDYLLELGEDTVFELKENGDYKLPGFAWLLEQLEPSEGKPAGIYRGSIYALADYVYNESTPWDGSAAEPFPGATEEVWKVTAVFEKAFLAQMPLVPMATLDSAVVYAANVKIEWPAFSSAFGWGAARYRYLTTDADFADGFYNSYEAAFLAGSQA